MFPEEARQLLHGAFPPPRLLRRWRGGDGHPGWPARTLERNGHPPPIAHRAAGRSDRKSRLVFQAPRRAPHLVVRDAELIGQAGVADALACMAAEVVRGLAVAAVGEHLDPERARRHVEIDVLAVALVTAHIDVRGLLQASAVAQRDAYGLAGNRTVEATGTVLHQPPTEEGDR